MNVLDLIAINAIAYFLYRILLFKVNGRLGEFFAMAFFVLALPSGLAFGLVDHLIQDRMYKRRCDDLRKMRYICQTRTIPSDFDISHYDLDCHMFIDEFGDFDWYEWHKHEFEKMGL